MQHFSSEIADIVFQDWRLFVVSFLTELHKFIQDIFLTFPAFKIVWYII